MLDNRQKEQLDKLLEYYFEGNGGENFERLHRIDYEGYKWRAAQIVHEENVTTALDAKFFLALKNTLTVANNLLYYSNRDTLLKLIDFYESEMRTLFCHLEYADEGSLKDRLSNFISGADELRKRDASRNWQKLAASDAMTCLAILKPDEYYIYRPFVMNKAYKYLNGTEIKGRSAVDKACDFHILCDDVLNYVKTKTTYIEKYRSLLNSDENMYPDPNLHLLVQNILYALQYSC